MLRPNPFQRSKRSEKIPVDGAYAGRVIQEAVRAASIALQVTKRNEQGNGFAPVRKRRVVERTLEWLGRYRCAGKDYERYCETEQHEIEQAMAAAVLQRLAPGDFPEICRKRRV